MKNHVNRFKKWYGKERSIFMYKKQLVIKIKTFTSVISKQKKRKEMWYVSLMYVCSSPILFPSYNMKKWFLFPQDRIQSWNLSRKRILAPCLPFQANLSIVQSSGKLTLREVPAVTHCYPSFQVKSGSQALSPVLQRSEELEQFD